MEKESKSDFWVGIIGIVVAVVLIVAITGYVKNITKLCDLDFEPNYKAEVGRIVGLTPLGCIIGYVEFEEEKEEVLL